MTGTKPPPVIRPTRGPAPATWDSDRYTTTRSTDFEFKDEDRTPIPWISIGLLLGALTAGLAISVKNNYLLGQIAVAVLGVSGFHGLWRGGLRKLIMLPVTFVVLFLVSRNPGFADPIVKATFGQSSSLANGIVCVITVVLTLVVVGFMVKLIRNRFIMKRPLMRGADRFFGTTVGLAEGAFTMILLCWAVVLLEPQARVVRDHPNRSTESIQHRVAAGIVQLAEEIQDSPLEPIALEANLLEEIPEIRDALYNLGERNQLDLEAMDPDARRKAMDNLRNLDTEVLGNLMDKMEKTHQDRDHSYQHLPKPRRKSR